MISDESWLKDDFIPTVQQRGAAIIKARGSSSAASAANAVVDTVRSLVEPTPEGDWHSVALLSQGEYDVDAGLISSFPVRSDGAMLEIAKWVDIPAYARWRIDQTVAELREERELVERVVITPPRACLRPAIDLPPFPGVARLSRKSYENKVLSFCDRRMSRPSFPLRPFPEGCRYRPFRQGLQTRR